VRLLATITVLGALLACGCGRDAARDQIRSTTAGFFADLGRKDGQSACAALSPNAVSQLEQQEQGSCDTSITELGLAGAAIRSVEVYAGNAKVDLTNGASAFLERRTAGWRISAVGCRATEGPPTSHPMHCELED
jgi:hypothetical protein